MERTARTRLVWVAFGLCTVAGPAGAGAPATRPEPRPLETLLPASTLASFSWEGFDRRGAALRQTALVSILRRPKVKDFFRRFYHSLRRHIDKAIHGDEELVRLRLTIDELLRTVVHAQVTVGVLSLTGRTSNIVVIIRRTGDPDNLNTQVDALLGVLADEDRRLRKHQRAGHTVWSFDREQALLPVGWVRTKTMVVVGVGPTALDETLAVMAGRAPSLLDTPPFQRAWAKTDGEGSLVRVFMNCRRLADGAGGAWSQAYGPWRRTLGLEPLEAVSLTLGTQGEAFTSAAFFDVPSPRRGIFAEFDQEPLDEKELAVVPPDADFFYATRWRLLGLYRRLVGLNVTGVAEPHQRPRRGLASFPFLLVDALLGFDLENDLLAHLGDTVIVYNSPSEGLYVTGLTLAITLGDRGGVRRCIERFVKARSAALARSGVRVVARNDGTDPFWVFRFDDDTPVEPTAGLGRHHVFVGLYPQPVLAGLRRSRNLPTGWPAPADYARIRRRLPVRAVTVRYGDMRQSARLLLGLAPVLIRLGWPKLRAAGLELDTASIPCAGEVAPYLFPNVGVTVADDAGVTSRAYMSVPLPAGLGEIATTVAQGSLLLRVADRLHRTRRMKSEVED